MVIPHIHPPTEGKMTVGKAALNLMKQYDARQSVIETQKAMQKGYVDSLIEAVEKGKKQFGDKEFLYVCVQTRRERLLDNVIRNQFYVRQTRPIPQYDLALYWYHCKEERIEFVWCIPDKESVERIIKEAKEGTLPLDQTQLLGFCISFKKGTLI